MGQITDRNSKYALEAQGKGFSAAISTTSGFTATAANTGSMHATVYIRANQVGSSFPGTLVDVVKLPTGSSPLRLSTLSGSLGINNTVFYLCYLYKLGTQVLTSTGDQFTHDAATFPVTRTIMGASQPVSLMPVIQVTSSTSTTAAVLTLKTAAGGAGYVDQDGNNRVGSRTFTMPAAATTTDSCFLLPLESGDSGIRDIAAIQTNTATSTGTANIWGMELIALINSIAVPGQSDAVFDAAVHNLVLPDIRPASPTGGTLTSVLAIVSLTTTSTAGNYAGYLTAIADT